MLPRGWAALLIVAAIATTARAQAVSDELGIERFRPAIDRSGVLDVESAEVPAHLSWGAGVLVGLAHHPLVVYDRQMNAVEAVVERRMTTTLVGSLALWERLELGATVDIVGYQTGAERLTMQPLPGGGLGDLRLVAKLRLARGESWQVAVVPALLVPGGGASGYLREAGAAFAPAVAASAQLGRVRLLANAGYHVKTRAESAGLVSDDELFARGGAAVGLSVADLWWSTSLARPVSDAESNTIAVEMLAGAARQMTPAFGAFVAGGVGLDNGFGTPEWRAMVGMRFEPGRERPVAMAPVAVTKVVEATPAPDVDTDGDGLVDRLDRCAKQAEDVDGFLDDDGCVDAMARVTGKVVDPEGRPIAGATVGITQLDVTNAAPLELTTGEDGTFSTELHGGTLTLTARANEYQEGTSQTSVASGTTGDVSITLVRKIRQGQLRGQVLSFGGQPVAATITVKSKTGTTSTTATADAEGTFTLELPAGAFIVEIAAPGHIAQKRTVNIKLDGVTVLNVDLRATK